MNVFDRAANARVTEWAVHVVGCCGLLLALGAAYAFVIAPQLDAFSRNETRRRSLQAMIKRGPTVRAEFESLKAAVDGQKKKLQRFRERLPSDPQEAEYLAQVSKLARGVELDVKEYRPGKVTERGNYSELEIELSCEGRYESICRFLDGLPNLPRLSSLTSVELEAKPEQSVYPIRLKLSAYFVPMKNDERS